MISQTLLPQAHALASRAQLLAVSRGKLSSSGDPEAVSELARDCQQLRREIEEVGRAVCTSANDHIMEDDVLLPTAEG